MSAKQFHNFDGQPPHFAAHAENRYQERVPTSDPIPMLTAYHQSLKVSIEDDCPARLYPPYDLLFIRRGDVVVTDFIADYSRLTVPRAIWCDHCGKPFKTDQRCTWCREPVTGSVSDGAITITRVGE